MTDNTQPAAGSTHIIRYALEMGLLWIDGDGRDKVREALDALDNLEAQLASIGAGGVSALMGAAKAGSEPVATVFTMEAAAAELRRLHALTTQQQRDLIAESHRTAKQKLRADQMTTQHAHQAALNTEARAQLAAALTAQAISKAPDHIAEVGNMVAQAISAEPAGAGYAELPDAKTLGEAVAAWIGVETRGAHNWVDTTVGRLGFAVRSVVGDMLRASHGQAPAGDWLWVKLMDFCKKRGFAPANFNDLFEIVDAARAARAPADNVQEDAAWMPLTPELLTAIESGNLGNRFWIAAHNSNEPQIGVYEWQQGRNPHGFNSDLSRYGASEITHVLPYKPPALPAALAARKQGATQ